MGSEDQFTKWAIIGSTVLVMALFAAVHLYPRAAPQVAAAQQPVESTVSEVSPPVQPSAEPARHSLVAPVPQVYECLRNGQRVFSDSPCGDDAHVRTVSPVNHMDGFRPSYTPAGRSTPGEAVSVQQRDEDSAADDTQDCSLFEKQKNALNERMRHGYTAVEGEWLREQFRRAQAKFNDCVRASRR